MLNQKPINYSLLICSLFLYGLLGYYIQRHETVLLLPSYFSVFAIYLYITLKSPDENTKFWFYASILFRITLLFSVPALSDDFYRFIWDGRLLASGYHPFAEVPSYYIQKGADIPGINIDLFQKLNSSYYFTIYPPVAQFIFWLGVKISPNSVYGSVLVMKSTVFLAEIGSLILIKKLLIRFKLPAKRILIYALNPLVILELTGNIHLEAIMIFFLLLCIFLLFQKYFLVSAMAFSGAVCVKLIPLIFLPALLPRLGWKKSFVFYTIVGCTCLVLFLPLFDREIISGFQNSIGYYFKKFEFNASLYYIVRAWGISYYGYNIIQTAGWILGLVGGIFIVAISLFGTTLKVKESWLHFKPSTINQQRPSSNDPPLILLWILLLYFLFTTTLHPWYITTLLMLSIFTSYRFVVLWTALIFLTYAGYTQTGFHENLWITLFEYLLVLSYLVYELLWRKKESLS